MKDRLWANLRCHDGRWILMKKWNFLAIQIEKTAANILQKEWLHIKNSNHPHAELSLGRLGRGKVLS